MYKFERYRQLGLADFNQPVGLKMNPENRWVKKVATIPWDAIEEKYAQLFPAKTGMPATLLTIRDRTSVAGMIPTQRRVNRKTAEQLFWTQPAHLKTSVTHRTSIS